VNAAERATSLEITSKIAAVVNLFKAEFPDIKADLKPWANDPDTRDLIDPDSIDLGFHFPGWSRSFQSRSILMQIRFHADPVAQSYRAIGIEMAGFDHRGKQWQFSTIESWSFVGSAYPESAAAAKLKYLCQQIFQLFNSSEPRTASEES
jgi:hypothetical protein